ncbi:hypothetical protein BH24CHL9_BH24CHL9_05420 [soil metagenome]
MEARSRAPHVPYWLILALSALAAFTFIYVLTHHLFVWTEARGMILDAWPGDLQQWLLFPEPFCGAGRLTGIATFQLTGRVCGVDTDCVNAVGAILTAGAMVLLIVNTRQITRSVGLAVVVALMWLLSPAVLGISIWQSARFDILAFIGAMAAGALWWKVFGQRILSRGTMVLAVVASILTMAFAFNAKETMYYLAGLIVFLAVVRGAGVEGAIRRNLAIALIPVAYATFFIAHALTHTDPTYAASVGGGDVVRRVQVLIFETLGLHDNFMFVWQRGGSFEWLNTAARVGYVVLVAAVVSAGYLALRRARRSRVLASVRGRRLLRLIRHLGPWLYLAGTAAIIIGISSRSLGAAVYYLPIASWALLVLGVLVLRWLSTAFRYRRTALALLLALFALAPSLGYLSYLTERSTYRQLNEASARMDDASAILRGALAGREVAHVAWRMLALPDTSFFVTRGDARTYQPGRDIWPWLMRDPGARPDVTPLADGTQASLRDDVQRYAGPGQVLLVMTGEYDLVLLAHEGQILWERSAA